MSYIITYTKKHFVPAIPEIEKICIKDIAHALSLLCRANGHFPIFYSVAQHSINCCREAKARGYSKNVQLACLLHDASEAYISDITRPIKKLLPNYLDIEERLQNMIWEKFLLEPLSEKDEEQVFEIDDCMLYNEFNELMHEKFPNEEASLVADITFEFEDFNKVEKTFIKEFKKLTGY